MRAFLLILPAAIVGACAGPGAGLEVQRLADGRYEVGIPVNANNVAWAELGATRDLIVADRAKILCPSGYRADGPALRQRQGAAVHSEVWTVTCN